MAVVATRDDSRPEAVDAGARIAVDESESAPRAVIDAVAGTALDPQRGDKPRGRGEDGVIDRTTGATEAQIEAACQSRMTEQFAGDATAELTTDRQRHHVESMVRVIAPHLVPFDHRIIGPDDIAVIRQMCTELKSRGNLLYVSPDEVDRLAALIGDGNG
jgi:hypothetical protein